MDPPRRWRPSCVLSFLFAVLLFSSAASAAAAVLGIDVGTGYIKAALVKPGALDIVLSKDSKRKEVAAIAFKPLGLGSEHENNFPERLYGSDAIAVASKIPGNVFLNLKPLLGISAANGGEDERSTLQEYRLRRPALDFAPLDDQAQIGFHVPSFADNEPPFSISELLAMEIQNIKENAQQMTVSNYKISNAVITVPPFYTIEERNAVKLAAELAGLNVLGLLADGTAVGINYAMNREWQSIEEGGKPEYHLVFDMGAGSTTATVLRFLGKTVPDVGKFTKTVQEVAVMGIGWDKTLGGDAMTGVVVDQMVDDFVASSAIKNKGISSEMVKSNGRTAASMWKEAERVRRVLSANLDSQSTIEGLFQDEDFRFKLSRTAFEKMTENFAERVELSVRQALDISKLTFNEIESVILHGGATRTPSIQKRLEMLAGGASKLRSNVNADEAAVFGAAFIGAGLNPSYKVKSINVLEVTTYSILMRYKLNGEDAEQVLFPAMTPSLVTKGISFKGTEEILFTLYQQVPNSSGSIIEKPVLEFKTTNLTHSVTEAIENHGCDPESITSYVKIQLESMSGLPGSMQAYAACQGREEDTDKGGVIGGVKEFFGFGSKPDDQQPLAEEDVSEVIGEEVSSPASSTSSGEAVEEVKRRPYTVHLGFSVNMFEYNGFSAERLEIMKNRLADFNASDKARRQRDEAFNAVESLTYRARDLIVDEIFISASTEHSRTQLDTMLHETSAWLYSDGQNASKNILMSKLKDLKAFLDPVEKRMIEAERRPMLIKTLRDELEQTKMILDTLREPVKKKAESPMPAEEVAESSAADNPSISKSSVRVDSHDDDDGGNKPEPSQNDGPTSPSGRGDLPVFSDEELAELSAMYDYVSGWLETNLARQNSLAPSEDPVVSASELETKAKILNETAMKLLQKKLYVQKGRKKDGKSNKKKSGRPKGESVLSTKTSSEGEQGPEIVSTGDVAHDEL